MRTFPFVLLASLVVGLASANHVPGLYAGAGTVTFSTYDERDGSTVECEDETLVAVFQVESATTGTLRFHEGAGSACTLSGWSDTLPMTGTPSTGYVYEFEACFQEQRVELGPLGAATSFTYDLAYLTFYEPGAPMPACTPEPGQLACLCPAYRIEGVIDFA